ncbi:MAG: NADPH-dependent 7-cyano-7-deazaguanine reductase QueF [Campylobacteraceae bacterium]|nr:NADPH-dependent 7-cyano-7-deazaguanine reductase QueF [Campylobacteraceae bacterium]
MKYGEKILKEFDVDTDLEIWPNNNKRDYTIKITLPEFTCLCPRSGYPDFATIYVEYIPGEFVVELKAIKLYINSFMSRNISHENSINEIYEVLETKLKPKYLKVVGDFNPRGNVHTLIEIDSNLVAKQSDKESLKDEILKAIKDEFKSEKIEREEKRKVFSEKKESGFKKEFRKDDKREFKDSKESKERRGSKFGDRKDDKKSFDSKKPKREPFFKLNTSDKKPTVVKKDDNR